MTQKNHLYFSVFIAGFLVVSGAFVVVSDVYAEDPPEEAALTEEEQKAAEEEAEKKEEEEELEEDLEKTEKKLKKAEEEKAQAQSVYNARYQDLTAQRYKLAQTTEDVQDKESQITHLEGQLTNLEAQKELHKKTLAGVVRQLYFFSGDGTIANVLESAPEQQFLLQEDRSYALRQEMVNALDQIRETREDTEAKKAEIEEAKAEKEKLLAEQKKQEQALAGVAAQAQAVVRSAEATVSELNSKMASLQSKLSALLGGVSTDDIVEAAEFASDKTGVRKSFILGMLIVETDLGRFTGGCNYKQSRMSEYRVGFLKKIVKELDYDIDDLKFSCPPKNYRGTGGAMGAAQFMPDTWWGYKDRIAAHTGNNPPDPWSLTDGVMAMALKLANDGATTKSGEWNAAARYLGSCRGNTRFYCENVLYWADNYKKKL